MNTTLPLLGGRFRGYLPVVIDIETGGFNPHKNPLLEIAAVLLQFDHCGDLRIKESHAYHIQPFKESEVDPAALQFNGIDPDHPFRFALDEKEALKKLFKPIRENVKFNNCTRAVMVAHNPAFDIGFLNAAVQRTKIKRNPFHPFSTFDTATLGGLVYGQTVLSKAVQKA
ncbi:MAG: exonuclease domain-containing protein, partial [Gammaproteobacteria bacterium]